MHINHLPWRLICIKICIHTNYPSPLDPRMYANKHCCLINRNILCIQFVFLFLHVDILNTSLKKKDAEIKTLQAKVTSLQQALENKETELRRKELELLRDLDIAQEKNDVSF